MTTENDSSKSSDTSQQSSRLIGAVEVAALFALFFIYAGDPAPAVNEAHYLVKAKNYWDATYCANDLFASSGKAHTTFYLTFGWLTQVVSLEATAWIGRLVGWLMLAIGLRRCTRSLKMPPFYCLGVAVVWLVGIEYGNLAGEWVVGGIEAKVPAYAMVLIGLSEIIRRKWSRAWIWFGGASAFHVLTGGWAVVAAVIAFLICERWESPDGQPTQKFFTWGLFIGGALSLFGLVPAVQLTLGSTPEDSIEAARIYSYVRIRHHLLPSDFPIHWFIRHGVLVAGLIALAVLGRRNAMSDRLVWFGVGAMMIAFCGLLVGLLPAYAPDLTAKLLRYYWFRLSDAIVPLVLAFWLMSTLSRRFRGAEPTRDAATGSNPQGLIAVALLLISAGLFCQSVYNRNRLGIPPSTSHRLLGVDSGANVDGQRQSHADWVAVCDWVRLAMPPEEVLLTPRHQQTFKWYSGHAEVVNWKDVPQDAKSLLEWKRRFDDVYPKRLGTVPINSVRVPIGYAKLREYRQRYGVRFMVVDNRIATKRLPLARIYPVGDQTNQTYSVYELPYGH